MNTNLEKSLEKLKSIKWKKLFRNIDLIKFNEIDKAYFDMFPFFPISNEIFEPKEMNKGHYYRVRPLDEINDYRNFKEYSYPPKEFVSNQRANIVGQPVFYSSIHPRTAVLEFVLNQRKYDQKRLLALSVWELKSKRNMSILKLVNESNSKNEIRSFAEHSSKSFKTFAENKFGKHSNVIINLRNYFINSFCLKNNHVFSSYIAHKSLYDSKEKTDIIIYPSIAGDLSSINVAFNSDFADENLFLKRVYIVDSTKDNFVKSTVIGKVLTFENNEFKNETIIDNKILLNTLIELDFGDSIKV
ncbi:RES domain-containing protein [Lacinutrix himadriensis]|uniref:RES domain-containing protein n=1 Tax=Lacinutrix himadriensis TaxID=641549 RepID=UPI0006E31AB4|nr:RES domain-containing protein [Lacinutrix himadriensis]